MASRWLVCFFFVVLSFNFSSIENYIDGEEICGLSEQDVRDIVRP